MGKKSHYFQIFHSLMKKKMNTSLNTNIVLEVWRIKTKHKVTCLGDLEMTSHYLTFEQRHRVGLSVNSLNTSKSLYRLNSVFIVLIHPFTDSTIFIFYRALDTNLTSKHKENRKKDFYILGVLILVWKGKNVNYMEYKNVINTTKSKSR